MEFASVTTAAAGVLLILVWLVINALKSSNGGYWGRIPNGARLPPGPLDLPFLGDIKTLLSGLSAQRALAWSGIYGPVIRVKAGSSETIVLNDLDVIRTFLNHKDLLYRSRRWVLSETVDLGFGGYGGKSWDENRRFSMKLLRELGFGRPAMGEVIAEGCRRLLSKIAESQGEPIDLFDLILASASSNIGVFVLGHRYQLGHPEHQRLCKALREEFMTSRDGSVLSSMPSLAAAFSQYFPSSRTATLITAMRSIEEFASTHLFHHMATLHDKEDRDFIDAYLRKSKGHEHEAGCTYSLSSLAGNVVSFLLAGAVTASGSLMRELLLVAANPDTVQARIQSEIDTVMGSERQPAWADRVSTPYTTAFIWEAHRRYTMMPLGVPRRACEDVVIGEHFIPQDATVVANLWAVHNNPAIWNDPEKFDPTRLLNRDGSISGDKLQRVIPFSVGKRMCPGEIFASVEIYMYLTSILQKFRVLPVKGHVVDVNVKDSEIMRLGRHKLRCVPRINTAP